MITLIQISDIHFKSRDHQTQFDVEQHIRRAIIRDVKNKPGGTDYDALLISGDIAFSGDSKEYAIASKFLDEFYGASNLDRERTYVIPGNHDVDRTNLKVGLPLCAVHREIRGKTSDVEWREIISHLLHNDPLKLLLLPLKAYNDFAIGFDCETTGEQLCWSHVLPLELEDGTLVRIHGLNSALVSDEEDAPNKILVSQIQTSHFDRAPNVVEVVMCHHPNDWLMDKVHVREALDAFAKVVLWGHEHQPRVNKTDENIQVYAGAVQPAPRDNPHWLPTYNIIQLSVEGVGVNRTLKIKVHTREFHKDRGYTFHPRVTKAGVAFEEKSYQLADWTRQDVADANVVAPLSKPDVVEQQPKLPAVNKPTADDAAKRELRVNFFQLGAPLRYQAALNAQLVQDGDDALDSTLMWTEVFRRAYQNRQALANFWDAVAKFAPSLHSKPNPFRT